MTPNQYQELCARTECNQMKSRFRMMFATKECPEVLYGEPKELVNVRVNHAILGIIGECGEISTAFMKGIYYGKSYDKEHLSEEFGDLLWFVAEGLNALGLSMEDVMEANIRKLKARYPDKFTEEAFANRDLEKESKALQNQIDTGTITPVPMDQPSREKMREDHPNPFGYNDNI